MLRPLSRELIVAGAIELIEQEGSTALSMRRLGSKRGVNGVAIYHDFDVGGSRPHGATSELPGPPHSSCSACSPSARPHRCDRSRSDEFSILGGRVRELAELSTDNVYELDLDALLAGLADPHAGHHRGREGRRSTGGRL